MTYQMPYGGNQNQGGQQFPPNSGMPQRQDMQQEQMRQQMMMMQQQNQMTVPMQPQPVPPPALPQQTFSPASRIVASRNEAEATPADFSGAPMAFYDAAKDCFYMKRWDNVSGSALFLEYPRSDGQKQNDQFASAQEVRDLYDMVENLMQDVDRLKRPNNQNRKGSESK